jgi:site-specific recombinase XerD
MNSLQKVHDQWMQSLKADNTRVAYEKAFINLCAFAQKSPLQLLKQDIERWVDHLTQYGLSGKTTCMFVGAVSSFYNYAKRFGYYIGDNPTKGVKRPLDKPVEEIYWLNLDEVKRLLSVMDKNTVVGRRDFALFLSYIMLGRRNTEIRNLRFCDFEMIDGLMHYRWSGKGKINELAICPPVVSQAIMDYIKISGRFNVLKKTDYVFIKTQTTNGSEPLSITVVEVLLKQYAAKAGLDVRRIHVHCLRHTSCMLRLDAGESIENISKFLGHSSVSITKNNYIHNTEAV